MRAFVILVLVGYTFYKVLRYLLGISFKENPNQQGEPQVDFKNQQKTRKGGKEFRGGEYVDYEEVD